MYVAREVIEILLFERQVACKLLLLLSMVARRRVALVRTVEFLRVFIYAPLGGRSTTQYIVARRRGKLLAA